VNAGGAMCAGAVKPRTRRHVEWSMTYIAHDRPKGSHSKIKSCSHARTESTKTLSVIAINTVESRVRSGVAQR